ncbi:hypothetical protein Taro_021970 [Colocasia esculenta]|uniref:Uncharacterized protein n=1 Tax=Colocasia esculenta TaxID=4460 RepID=A0A843V0E3_COLES|nr:hypothetical protein [Colocasia esculenta]
MLAIDHHAGHQDVGAHYECQSDLIFHECRSDLVLHECRSDLVIFKRWPSAHWSPLRVSKHLVVSRRWPLGSTSAVNLHESISSSLEDYNKQIGQLKQEMNDATRGADSIRNDINALAQRYAVIDRDEEYGAEYILDLQKQLSLLAGNSKVDLNGSVDNRSMTSTTPTDELQSRLDDAIASECPFCGDLMIREISLSFLLPEESNYADSWDITPPAGSQKILPMTM